MLLRSARWLVVLSALVGCVKVTPVDEASSDRDRPVPSVEPDQARERALPRAAVAPPPDPPPPTAAELPDPAPELEAILEAAWPEAGLTLDDRGREPHAPLRLDPRPGVVQRLTLSIGTRVALRVGTKDMPSGPVPPVEVRLETEVESVADDEIVYRFRVVEVTHQATEETIPRVAAAVRKALGSLEGATGRWVVDRRGVIASMDLGIASSPDDPLQPTLEGFYQALHQLLPPLPSEAIGVGATWTRVAEVEHNGMRLMQRGRYTLVSREANVLKIAFEIEQRRPNDGVGESPAKGTTLAVQRFVSTAKGQVAVDLSKMLPLDGTSETRSATDVVVAVGGGREPVHVDVALELSLRG